MNDAIVEILDRIRELEDRLEKEFDKNREYYACRLKGKIAEFRQDVIEQHRRFKQSLPQYFRTASLVNVLVAPVIYSMIVPIALLDLWVTIYQHVCFRAYGIPRVIRRTFISYDRQHLAYLNVFEKLNCVYCGYGNGVIAYAREVASRTEQYWCPIKHALRIRDPHLRYLKFLEFGDAEGYRARLKDFRKDVQNPE